MKLRTQSLASCWRAASRLKPHPRRRTSDSPSGAEFTLFDDQAAAMAPPDGEPRYVHMRFAQSLRGLSVGAPVDFVGVNIGQVFSVDLDYDAEHESFPVIVTALIYPDAWGKLTKCWSRAAPQRTRTRWQDSSDGLWPAACARNPYRESAHGPTLHCSGLHPRGPPARFAVDARHWRSPRFGERSGAAAEDREHRRQDRSSSHSRDRRHLDADLVGLDGLSGNCEPTYCGGGAAFNSLHTTLERSTTRWPTMLVA